jgi:hypothetical protein
MKLRSGLAALSFAFAGAGSAHATEFLQNGSFETGDFSAWMLTDASGLTTVQQNPFGYHAESGKFYVYAGPPTSAPGILSQTFADTAGQKLNISGWAIGDTFDLPNNLGEVSYFFDGVNLGSPDLSSGDWTHSTFQVTATGSDTFSIQFANDTSFNGLDNFSVANTGSIPEPPTWVLSLLGFVGLGLLARTGRKVLSRVS